MSDGFSKFGELPIVSLIGPAGAQFSCESVLCAEGSCSQQSKIIGFKRVCKLRQGIIKAPAAKGHYWNCIGTASGEAFFDEGQYFIWKLACIGWATKD